jgi:hypothetical protein
MFKYIFCFLLFLFLQDINPGFSQSGSDSVETVEESPDSLYMPLADSRYTPVVPIREVAQKQVDVYLKNPAYAYANDPAYWGKETKSKPGFLSRLFNSSLVAWVILLGVLGLFGLVLYGIYLLAKENSFSWFTRNVKKINSDSDELLTDKRLDYEETIRKYQEEGNYRMAIRYMYLRLIHTAREKGGIQFRDSSTNAEIARAFGNHPKAGEFRWLATAYEYIFYGDFLPKQELFDTLKNKFETFQQTLSI